MWIGCWGICEPPFNVQIKKGRPIPEAPLHTLMPKGYWIDVLTANGRQESHNYPKAFIFSFLIHTWQEQSPLPPV